MNIQNAKNNIFRDSMSHKTNNTNEFTLILNKIESNLSRNNGPINFLSDYLTTLENINEKYDDEHDQNLEINSHTSHYMDAVSVSIEKYHSNYNGHDGLEAIKINCINDLMRHFEKMMPGTDNMIDSKWQFHYIDSKLGCLDMVVKKVNKSNISIIFLTQHINEISMTKITQNLQSRLLSKGWKSKICLFSKNEIFLNEKERHFINKVE